MSELSTYQRSQLAKAREICDFVEEIAPLISGTVYLAHHGSARVWYSEPTEHDDDKRSAKVQMADDMRAIKGNSRIVEIVKNYETDTFRMTFKLTSGATFEMYTSRDAVCVRKVVGTEVKTVKDYDAAPTKEITEEIVEWECAPILDVPNA